MSQNLITSGKINPMQFSVQQLLPEAAIVLGISPNRILEIQCWNYQLWVNIKGVGGKFISYRRLPMWMEVAKKAISVCTTQASLDELAVLFRVEIQRYGKYYSQEDIEMLRQIWSQQSQNIKAEEERLQPMKAHTEAANAWKESWINIFRYCPDIYALKRLMGEIQQQSEAFLDIPEVIQAVEEGWAERWHEIMLTTA